MKACLCQPKVLFLRINLQFIIISQQNEKSTQIDKNKWAQSYTYLKINKPYIALNLETYISLRRQELTT